MSAAAAAKKSGAKKSAKKPAQHPMYRDMIAAAIKNLASKSGSSKLAISKYISANYKVGERHDVHLKAALIRGIQNGALVKKTGLGCSGSFKLPKPVPTKKLTAPAKKNVSKKKTPAAPKGKKKAAPAANKKKPSASTPSKKKKKPAAPKRKSVPATKKAPVRKPPKKTPKKGPK